MRLAVAIAMLALAACATAAPEPVVKVPHRTHYTLRAAPALAYTPPLPSRTDIYVDWHYSDGSVESKLAFIGWDVLGHDRFGLLEVLNDAGQPSTYIYDFDGDGKVDLTLDVATGTAAD